MLFQMWDGLLSGVTLIKIEAPSWALELIRTKYDMKRSVRCRYDDTWMSEIEGKIMEFGRAD
jgi:hypothetical protein